MSSGKEEQHWDFRKEIRVRYLFGCLSRARHTATKRDVPQPESYSLQHVFSVCTGALFFLGACVFVVCVCVGVCCVCSCLTVHKGSGGLTFTSARVLVRAPIDGPGCLPNDTRDHTFVKSVFSCPHEPDDHRVCVIAMRLGYLHKLAHAQQDMVISVAPPRPGAHFFLRWDCSPNKRRSPTNGEN